MIRAAIHFVASFGCELEFDDQTHAECYSFTDELGRFRSSGLARLIALGAHLFLQKDLSSCIYESTEP